MKSARNRRLLALVPARGGSKGLPRKNVLSAGGQPLIAWTILAAMEASSVDYVVVSSDDNEIIEIAKKFGAEVPFLRPANLSDDSAASMDVVMHAIDLCVGFDYVALLQPTSPLRTSRDIDDAFHKLISSGAESCVSVCAVEESPYWMYQLDASDRLVRLLPDRTPSRRQELPPVYMLNGAIYIARVSWLRQTRSFTGDGCVAYIMPRDRSLDIDTPADFDEFCRVIGE
jgi:CMP-N,N'-diacetyllegionaminic acid synthase